MAGSPTPKPAAVPSQRLWSKYLEAGRGDDQFFFGMITNLYVVIPADHPGAGAHDYFSGVVSSVGWALSAGPSGWLSLHAALGLLLALGALEFVGAAARARAACAPGQMCARPHYASR